MVLHNSESRRSVDKPAASDAATHYLNALIVLESAS